MSSTDPQSKLIKWLHWASTLLVSAMMLYSAYGYLTSDRMFAAFRHLGFPGYFRIELAVMKALGVITLLIPGDFTLKEWAYAGFTITFISAVIAHLSSGDPMSVAAMPVVALAFLMGSYATRKKSTTAIG